MSDSTAQKDALKAERAKIVRLVKNWHTRVQHKLRFDASMDDLEKQWTRFLDIDLLLDPDDCLDSNSVNAIFKEVKTYFEPTHKDGGSQQPADSSSQSTEANPKPLSAQTTKELQSAHTNLTLYMQATAKRLEKDKVVDRKRFFSSVNGLLATSMMLGQVDCDIIDSLLARIIPTSSELRFIMKKLPVLSQHLKETCPSLFDSVSSSDVQWEKVFTNRKKPMLQVDNYLFYKVKESNTKLSNTSYFICIESRSQSKCPCRVKMSSDGEVTFMRGRKHNHPVEVRSGKKRKFHGLVS